MIIELDVRNVETQNQIVAQQIPISGNPTTQQVPVYYPYTYGIYPYSADAILGIFYLTFLLMIPLIIMIVMIKMLGGVLTE